MTTTPSTRDEFFEALRETRERPKGRATAAVVEELVDAAETFGDDEVTVSTLVELMRAYHGSGEAVKYPVTFARLLQLWDANPKAFDEWETHQLFWYFKWVTSGLLVTPDVPLASIRGWIAEMRRRYEAAGHDLQPVYGEEYQLAGHLGENELLAYELWATRGRTDLSDCAACEARQRGDHHFRHGEDERGLAELQPTFDGRHSCDEEPHSSQTLALLPLLRLGRYDEARAMHLGAYRKVRGKEAELTDIGRHLEFCALTGNEARGLELLSQSRASFGFAASPSGRLEFLTGVQVLLARLEETGHGALPCAGPLGAEWTVASLRASVAAQAEELAARFDARNGNDAFTARRRERLDRRPLVAQLNLGVQTAALVRTAEAVPVDAASADTASAGVTGTPGSAAVAELPEDFAELFAEARRLDAFGHPRAKQAWDTLLARVERGDAGELSGLKRADIASELAQRAVQRKDWDACAAHLDEAVALYTAAGEEARAVAAQARAVWCAATRSDVTDRVAAVEAAEAAFPVLDVLLSRVDALTVPGEGEGDGAADGEGDNDAAADGDSAEERRRVALRRKLVVRNSRVFVARHAALRASGAERQERQERWAAVFAEEARTLIAEAAAAGLWLQSSVAYEVLAEFRSTHGAAVEGEAAARQALAIFEEQGWSWRVPRGRLLLALALGGQRRFPEAMAELERGLAEAPADLAQDELTPLHRMLGTMAMQQRQYPTAVRALSETAARLDREGEALEAREIRLYLARALRAQGSVGDAAAVLESLLDLTGPAEAAVDATGPASGDGEPSPADQLTAQIRVDLANALLSLNEPRDAAAQFLQTADLVGRWPDRAPLTAAAAGAAGALAQAGNWDGARAAIERALESNREAPCLPDVTDALRTLAIEAVDARGADGADEALGYVDRADAVREELAEAARTQFRSVEVDLAQNLYVRGRVLGGAGRPEEALPFFERAVATYDAAGFAQAPPRFEAVRLAALVEGRALDRAPAARLRLDRAAAEADAAGLPDAAATLRRLRGSLQ
ncbi:tetratricopeptide (TPR) repeat protein [Streptacidiphilus sp. MAP12-33]|uniref:hypothetical protein n=1 Tax=Streptacidiphilus sp. MAP12-33 TaxID=3156266 RepID=UPI0035190A0A